jgi:hypothetical protein
MKLILSLAFFSLVIQLNAQNDEVELEKALFDLPGYSSKNIQNPGINGSNMY